MFKELAPLLHQRSVVIMVNSLEGDRLSVAVFPKRLNDIENAALSTPVSLTGTPQELDEQLPSTLTEFVGANLELKNTLELAKEEMARAAKAAKEESKAKVTAKAEGAAGNAAKPSERKQITQPAKAAEVKTPPPPSTANLFDFGSAPTPTTAPAATHTAATTQPPAGNDAEEQDEESEILSEIAEEEPGEELNPAA